MSGQPNFLVSLKSTIDKMGFDLATSLGQAFVDLDDPVNTAELLASDADAIVWEFLSLDQAPIDPLYSIVFAMGARTVNDAANYNILDFAGQVGDLFPEQEEITILDYTGATVDTTDRGYMFITSVTVDPQQFDKMSGIRLVRIEGKAVRF